MSNGSFDEYDPNRPKWGVDTEKLAEYIYKDEDGEEQFQIWKGKNKDGDKCFAIRRENDLSISDRAIDRDLEADYFPGYGPRWEGDEPAKIVLYRLPELLKSTDTVFLVEGEKDVETLFALGLTATSKPFGALAPWRDEFSLWLKGRDVVILQDNDENGKKCARMAFRKLWFHAKSVKSILLPDLEENGDVSDWLGIDGNNKEKLLEIVRKTNPEKYTVYESIAEVAKMADEYEKILIAKYPVYQFGERLVVPAISHFSNQEIVDFQELDANNIVDKLSRCANFVKADGRRKGKADEQGKSDDVKWLKCAPNQNIAKVLLSRRGEWKAPVVRGVINAPTIRTDGSLLDKPGYDPVSGLYLFTPIDIGPIPERPSKAECVEALEHLKDILAEFPFSDGDEAETKGEVSKAVALALLMTPIIRPMIRQSPLFMTSANSPGVGKTLLQELVEIIARGCSPDIMSQGESDKEFTKRIDAACLAGRPFIMFDNINRERLNNPTLCALITSDVVSIREYGLLKNVRVENIFTVSTNGNGIAPQEDLIRRTMYCRLETNDADPISRKVKIPDLKQYVRDRRAILIRSILTIVRGYLRSGERVLEDKPYASFGEWSRMVREPLFWLMNFDVKDSIASVKADDPLSVGMDELVAAWPKNANGTYRELSAAEINDWQPDAKRKKGDLSEAESGKLRERLSAIFAAMGNWKAEHGEVLKSSELGKELGKILGKVIAADERILKFQKHRDRDKGFLYSFEVVKEGKQQEVESDEQPEKMAA